MPWESDPRTFLTEPAKSDVEGLKVLLQRPELTPLHLVRLLRLARLLQVSPHEGLREHLDPMVPRELFARLFASFRDAHQPRLGLRELAMAFRASALDEDLITRSFLPTYHGLFQWDDSSTWPYFASRLDWVARELDPPPTGAGDWDSGRLTLSERKLAALTVIASFPHPPQRFVPHLWEVALGKPEAERFLAQRSLEKLADCGERLLKALSGGIVAGTHGCGGVDHPAPPARRC